MRIPAKLDRQSGGSWTAIPKETGHSFRRKLDSDSEGRWTPGPKESDEAMSRHWSPGLFYQTETSVVNMIFWPFFVSSLAEKRKRGMDTSEASTRASVGEGRRQPSLSGARQLFFQTQPRHLEQNRAVEGSGFRPLAPKRSTTGGPMGRAQSRWCVRSEV